MAESPTLMLIRQIREDQLANAGKTDKLVDEVTAIRIELGELRGHRRGETAVRNGITAVLAIIAGLFSGVFGGHLGH